MRLSLFNQIFLRVIGLIIFVVVAMLAFNHMHEQRALLLAWQADLQQEAEWIGRHWSPLQPPDQFAHAWHATHDGVRLQIFDADGLLIADSEPMVPDTALPISVEPQTLVGHAPIELAEGLGALVLSRSGLPISASSVSVGLSITALMLVAIAALVLFPMVKGITNSLSGLSRLAARVADGQFGETIPEKGNREIATLIASFNEMSLRLKAAEQQNERLLSDVSHELRSPLARLRALIETIQRHPDETAELSAKIENEVSLMNRLIDDVLASSKFETPDAQLNLASVNLNQWAREATAQLGPRLSAADISFNLNISDASANAAIDSQRLMQVLGNVVDNAMRAVEEASTPRIGLQTTTENGTWVCRISDNGAGISEEDLPLVFDRFFRVDQARTRSSAGAGLGLSICKAILAAHGGTIAITSTLGKGSIVELRLPSQQLEQQAEQQA